MVKIFYDIQACINFIEEILDITTNKSSEFQEIFVQDESIAFSVKKDVHMVAMSSFFENPFTFGCVGKASRCQYLSLSLFV